MPDDFPLVDFDAFHREDLPGRLARGNGALAAPDVQGIEPIAFRTPDGPAYTYRPRAATIDIVPGDASAGTVVELTAGDFSNFVHELQTAPGLLYGGRLRFHRGGYAQLERWEPALRAMIDGRPIYEPARLDLRARDGSPLELRREFSAAEPAEDLAHFLDQAGYLLVKQVLSPDEVDRLSAAVERLRALAVPGDRRSWWARDRSGQEVLCRITYANRNAPEIAGLHEDPRLLRLAMLAADGLRPAPDRCDGHSVVIKNADVVEGLSDLPWHRDCGLGGHPIMCPNVQLGIQLDAATRGSGQLHMLAGSHRASCHRFDATSSHGLPIVAIDTEPGDITVHFGDTMHAAPPPFGGRPGRRALYISFFSARTLSSIEPGKGYNDVMLSRTDGLVESIDHRSARA